MSDAPNDRTPTDDEDSIQNMTVSGSADPDLIAREVITALTAPDGARHHELDVAGEAYASTTQVLEALSGNASDLEEMSERVDVTRLASDLEQLREDIIEHVQTEQANVANWTLGGYNADGYETASMDDRTQHAEEVTDAE